MSWTGGGAADNFRRLDHWLNPGGGTAPPTIDGKPATTLTGPSHLCTSSDTYTITNPPAGATVTWSALPAGAVTLSGSGNSRTVTRVGGYNGQITLNVTLATACGNTQVEKKIWVGNALVDYVDIPTGPTVYPSTPFALRVFMQPDGLMVGSYNYRYEISGPGSYTSTELGSGFHTTSVPNTGFYFVEVYTQSECGWSTDFFPYSFYCAPGMQAFSVYPNPASETLTVSMGSEAERATVPDKSLLPPFSAVLYDTQGRQLRQGEGRDGAVQFDTRQLPDGTYFLHIHHDGQVEKRQVVIRH